MEMKSRNLTPTQYWFVIGIASGLLIINGILVFNLLTKDVLPVSCPVPSEEINICDCVRNAADGSLRYCVCYPGVRIDIEKLIEVENGSG